MCNKIFIGVIKLSAMNIENFGISSRYANGEYCLDTGKM